MADLGPEGRGRDDLLSGHVANRIDVVDQAVLEDPARARDVVDRRGSGVVGLGSDQESRSERPAFDLFVDRSDAGVVAALESHLDGMPAASVAVTASRVLSKSRAIGFSQNVGRRACGGAGSSNATRGYR